MACGTSNYLSRQSLKRVAIPLNTQAFSLHLPPLDNFCLTYYILCSNICIYLYIIQFLEIKGRLSTSLYSFFSV